MKRKKKEIGEKERRKLLQLEDYSISYGQVESGWEFSYEYTTGTRTNKHTHVHRLSCMKRRNLEFFARSSASPIKLVQASVKSERLIRFTFPVIHSKPNHLYRNVRCILRPLFKLGRTRVPKLLAFQTTRPTTFFLTLFFYFYYLYIKNHHKLFCQHANWNQPQKLSSNKLPPNNSASFFNLTDFYLTFYTLIILSSGANSTNFQITPNSFWQYLN